jgi:hypothetical protein
MTLAKLPRQFHFCVLAGIKEVRLEGEQITGRWKTSLTRFYGPEKDRLVQDFANWGNDASDILRFTKKYGPLQQRAIAGESFSFSLSDWVKTQENFRRIWVGMHKDHRIVAGWSFSPDEGGALEYLDGRLVYTAGDLNAFLWLDFYTCKLERLRTCVRPSCPARFFIAHHLRQRFCSENCAGWGQRISKKIWWKRKGEQWRKKRNKLKARKREYRPSSRRG